MIPVAEKCGAQKVHKLGTPKLQALGGNVVTDGFRILVVDVYRSTGWTTAKDV